MSKPSLLILGPGLIGGSLLIELIKQKKYEITVFLRGEQRAAEIRKLGVNAIVGSITDLKLIEEAVTANDIIINTMSADDVPSVEATLKSLKANPKTKAGTPKIYLQTSGAGVYGSVGNTHLDPLTIYSDDDLETISKLSPQAPHRVVDLAVYKASKEIEAKLVIIIPATTYAQGWGPFTKVSIQIPHLIRTAIKNGYASYGADGKDVFTHIHNADLVRAYIVLLDALQSDKIDVSQNPYINVANDDENTWFDVVERISKELVSAGAIKTDSIKSSGPKPDFYGSYRARSSRLKKLGWETTEKEALLDTIAADVAVILKE